MGFGKLFCHGFRDERLELQAKYGTEPHELINMHRAFPFEHIPKPFAVDMDAAGELGISDVTLLP